MNDPKLQIKSAQTPDKKPGRELAQRAEGFFCLEFLVLLFQDKRTSPRGNERDRISYQNVNISAEERSIKITCRFPFCHLRSIATRLKMVSDCIATDFVKINFVSKQTFTYFYAMRPKNLTKEASIRSIALQIIADEGLENLSMQKLAKAAGISPRTIYIKYENKEDLLVKLFIEEVLGAYEKATLQNFDPNMPFAHGVQQIWLNGFNYLTNNRHAFSLIQHGKASPLLNRAYQQKNIKEGDFFAPIHQFLQRNMPASSKISRKKFTAHYYFHPYWIWSPSISTTKPAPGRLSPPK